VGVAPVVRLGQREAGRDLPVDQRFEVLLALFLGTGEEDRRRPAGPAHDGAVEPGGPVREVLGDDGRGEQVDATPADLLRHIHPVEAGLDGLLPDGLDDVAVRGHLVVVVVDDVALVVLAEELGVLVLEGLDLGLDEVVEGLLNYRR